MSAGPLVRVLLVEDDVRVARVNREWLERDEAVHVIGTAATCAQAHELLRALKPDLVLLDVHLPDGSGAELLRAWRTAGEWVNVVMVTAAGDEATVRATLAFGVLDYLIKPFGGSRLAEAVARHRLRARFSQGRFTQADLDRFRGVAASEEALPKGVDAHTLERVAAALLSALPEALSAEDLGSRVGLSRVTAWRYLEFLVRSGQAELAHLYGAAGRPAKLYRART
ncbi:histidine kinase [Deinococcus irradiatisoli]|uniref:Transcriptional regulatory protein n=1 Tax=Deinococcus irradiatisoli TaxID=2202254 RepID=A0A2Z3JKM7_9DEIO|nr:response regulator [Deinococcus irradiatisoli]AWN21844.1 histidine kinase [Deinococcus irradiatisoli]